MLALPSATTIDRVVLREDQSQGQRVRAYTIEVETTGKWTQVATGTGIGNRQVELFSGGAVVATAVRLTITAAVAQPIISQFAAFKPCATS